jgi:hypothetical protein
MMRTSFFSKHSGIESSEFFGHINRIKSLHCSRITEPSVGLGGSGTLSFVSSVGGLESDYFSSGLESGFFSSGFESVFFSSGLGSGYFSCGFVSKTSIGFSIFLPRLLISVILLEKFSKVVSIFI